MLHRSILKITDLAQDKQHTVLQIEAPDNQEITYQLRIYTRGISPTDGHSLWELRRGQNGETINRVALTTGYKVPADSQSPETPQTKLYTWSSSNRTEPSDGELVNSGMFHPQSREVISGKLHGGERITLTLQNDANNVLTWIGADIWEG